MHEGKWSARLGLRGIPAICGVGSAGARPGDRALCGGRGRAHRGVARRAGAQSAAPGRPAVPLVHFQHLSAADSVRLVRQAKQEGLPVTAEVTPAHLLLTDERLGASTRTSRSIRLCGRTKTARPWWRRWPTAPSTAWAPTTPRTLRRRRRCPSRTPCSAARAWRRPSRRSTPAWCSQARVPLGRLVEAMSGAPCRVLGLEEPRLAVGAPADFCVVDLKETWDGDAGRAERQEPQLRVPGRDAHRPGAA